MLSSKTSNYLPLIIIKDGGNTSLSAQCSVVVQVYEFQDTVTIPMSGSVDDFNVEFFAELLSIILDYKVVVADVISQGPE